MEESLRRNLFIVLGALAGGALIASVLTILLALEQAPLILLVMLAILIVVIIAEIVLYVLSRPRAEDEPIEAEIVEIESG